MMILLKNVSDVTGIRQWAGALLLKDLAGMSLFLLGCGCDQIAAELGFDYPQQGMVLTNPGW